MSRPAASTPHVAVLFVISPPDFAVVVGLADEVAVAEVIVFEPEMVVVAVSDMLDDIADVEAELVDDPLDRAATTPPWTTDGVLLVALEDALLYPARVMLLSELWLRV